MFNKYCTTMDHWSLFATSTSEPTMANFNRSINSNSMALSRYESLNGHGGNTNSGINSAVNSSNMNRFYGSSNSSLNGSSSSMNLHSALSPHSSVNVNPFGSSYNSSGMGNSSPNDFGTFSSTNSSHNASPGINNGTHFNLNTSMPPPVGGCQGSSGMAPPSSHSYLQNRQQQPLPPLQQSQQPSQSMTRSRYSSGCYNSQTSNLATLAGRSGQTPVAFPPAPPPSMTPTSNPYYSNNAATLNNGLYGGNTSNMYHHQNNSMSGPPARLSAMPPGPPQQQQQHSNTSNYYSDNSTSSTSNTGGFPPIGEFKIGTFTIGANGVPTENSGSESNNRSFSGPATNGVTNGSTPSDSTQNVRETGIIEKLLQTYGFIQCCERQARLFFHFSQFDGNTDHLRIGDPVEFEVTFDRRTGKPIASTVQKISPEVVLSEERVVGAVTTELVSESGGEMQGRISYENRGECFFLPYGKDDVEGYVTLKPGDKVSFQIATNQRTGNLAARHVRLENPVAPVRYQGVVSAIKDAYGFIERADVVDEIFFHVSETKHIPGGLKLGDDVDFCITMRNGKEVAIELVKLQDGSVVFEDTSQEVVRGQVLKTVDRSPRHNPKEPLPGRIRYRGKDRSEVEVKFGERDQCGEFTLRHGDWVEFNIATDRRDRLQKATNITLLDESFSVSGERREQGVVKDLQEQCGYILCCERVLLLHFHYRELLDPSVRLIVGAEVAFTVTQDNTLPGPRKETATRISHLPPGTAAFEVFVQENLQGQIGVVAKEPLPLEPPVSPGSVVPPKEVLGSITYLLDGARQLLEYAYTPELALLKLGDKVTFSVHFSKRIKKLVATKVTLMTNSSSSAPLSSSTSSATSASSDAVIRTTAAASSVTANNQFSTTHISNSHNTETTALLSPHTNAAAIIAGNAAAATTAVLAASVNGSVSSVTSVITSNNDVGGIVSSGSTSPNKVAKTTTATSVVAPKNNNLKQQQPRHVYQGYVAALKESFGFLETVNHDKEIFFHFSNVENSETSKLELGDEVEYTLSTRAGPGGKVSAENITLLPKGTLPVPKIYETVYNGFVMRPIRSSNPDQAEYCGLLAVDTDDVERSEQYMFGITGVVKKRELLQKGDSVTFQVDSQGWATNVAAVRKKLIATVDTVKGQYGFLNYEAEEGKKLFFHQTEVKDKANLSPGDEVEFVIITNQKTGKSSACSIARIMPAGGQSRRPSRLISQLKTMSLDQSKPRILVTRQPRGPDGTNGFHFTREQLAAAVI